jgi:hypothetical protein
MVAVLLKAHFHIVFLQSSVCFQTFCD